MLVTFDDYYGNRLWLARGLAHKQSVSGLRLPSERAWQASRPLRSRFERSFDRVTVSGQLAFAVTHKFTRPDLLGQPEQPDLEAAYDFIFNLPDLYRHQRGLVTLITESAMRQSSWSYAGLLTAIDPRQIGATVIVNYTFSGARLVRPEQP